MSTSTNQDQLSKTPTAAAGAGVASALIIGGLAFAILPARNRLQK